MDRRRSVVAVAPHSREQWELLISHATASQATIPILHLYACLAHLAVFHAYSMALNSFAVLATPLSIESSLQTILPAPAKWDFMRILRYFAHLVSMDVWTAISPPILPVAAVMHLGQWHYLILVVIVQQAATNQPTSHASLARPTAVIVPQAHCAPPAR